MLLSEGALCILTANMATVISTEAHHYWPEFLPSSARILNFLQLQFSMCDYRMPLVRRLCVYCCWWFWYLTGRYILCKKCREIMRNFEKKKYHTGIHKVKTELTPHIFGDNWSSMLHPMFHQVTSYNLCFKQRHGRLKFGLPVASENAWRHKVREKSRDMHGDWRRLARQTTL